MGLYLGSEKVQIFFDGASYNLNLYTTTTPTLRGNLLLTSLREQLKTSNGLYITTKDGVKL